MAVNEATLTRAGREISSGSSSFPALLVLITNSGPAQNLMETPPTAQTLAAAVDHHYNSLKSLQVEFSSNTRAWA